MSAGRLVSPAQSRGWGGARYHVPGPVEPGAHDFARHSVPLLRCPQASPSSPKAEAIVSGWLMANNTAVYFWERSKRGHYELFRDDGAIHDAPFRRAMFPSAPGPAYWVPIASNNSVKLSNRGYTHPSRRSYLYSSAGMPHTPIAPCFDSSARPWKILVERATACE